MVEHTPKLMRSKWFPRPHDLRHGWSHSLESSTAKNYTIYPVIMHDEGLGAPSAYESNPEHASFVEATQPNCYPDSRINVINGTIEFFLTKVALETDKVHAVKCAYMPIFTSFKEDIEGLDEISTLDVGEILELQKEATDRQCYPLYNTVKMTERYANSALMDAAVPGLT